MSVTNYPLTVLIDFITSGVKYDLQNTNERPIMLISITMLLNAIQKQNTLSTGTLLSAKPTVRTIINALHLKAGIQS